MEEFILVYRGDGTLGWTTRGTPGTFAAMLPPEGMRAFLVSQAEFNAGEADLETVKASLISRVNAKAEAERYRFITPGAGQAMTYLRKEAEARAWVSGADPATAPMLAAEAAATGVTIDALAAVVIAMSDAWAATGAAIEGRRRALLIAIEAASDMAAIIAIVTEIEAEWL